MGDRRIPEDTASVTDAVLTDADWAAAAESSARFKALLETKPRAKASYEALLAEIKAKY